jgi:serine/threonine protein kinase
MASQSWPTFTSTVESQPPRPLSSSALDFLAVITATRGISIYKSRELQDRELGHLSLGSGGFCTVQQGRTREGEIVAIKQNRHRTLDRGQQDIQAFERELHQLCLELRILSHDYLRGHPNIIDILGICLDEENRRPYLSLVLEHSSYGTLKSFLVKHHDTIQDETLVDFMLQVSRGITALHRLKICHGDIKPQNVLIFQNNASWTLKISDLGQSIVGISDDSSAVVDCKIGTPLMNAPEIRSGVALADLLYDIEAAMATDVFSFGLLVWEIIKKGQCYFEEFWQGQRSDAIDVDLMEEYLNTLPHNELLNKSIHYLEGITIDSCIRTRLERLFRGSLQDIPRERKSMSQLTKFLDAEVATTDDR